MTPRSDGPPSAPPQAICPYLGTADDRATACLFVTDAHYCYRFAPGVPAPADFQSLYCLSGAHEQCENFRAATPAQRVLAPTRRRGPARLAGMLGGGMLAGVLTVAAVLLGVAVAVLQRDGGATGSGGGGTAETDPPATVFAAVATPAPATKVTGSMAPITVASPTATATLPAAATPSAVATQAAAAQPDPATPSPTGTLSPTGTPAPTPATAQAATPPDLPVRARYRVRPGDSVSAIAAYFGARLDDVLRLNGLTLTSIIWAGQELLIP